MQPANAQKDTGYYQPIAKSFLCQAHLIDGQQRVDAREPAVAQRGLRVRVVDRRHRAAHGQQRREEARPARPLTRP